MDSGKLKMELRTEIAKLNLKELAQSDETRVLELGELSDPDLEDHGLTVSVFAFETNVQIITSWEGDPEIAYDSEIATFSLDAAVEETVRACECAITNGF
jgi:hypothetical protein